MLKPHRRPRLRRPRGGRRTAFADGGHDATAAPRRRPRRPRRSDGPEVRCASAACPDGPVLFVVKARRRPVGDRQGRGRGYAATAASRSRSKALSSPRAAERDEPAQWHRRDRLLRRHRGRQRPRRTRSRPTGDAKFEARVAKSCRAVPAPRSCSTRRPTAPSTPRPTSGRRASSPGGRFAGIAALKRERGKRSQTAQSLRSPPGVVQRGRGPRPRGLAALMRGVVDDAKLGVLLVYLAPSVECADALVPHRDRHCPIAIAPLPVKSGRTRRRAHPARARMRTDVHLRPLARVRLGESRRQVARRSTERRARAGLHGVAGGVADVRVEVTARARRSAAPCRRGVGARGRRGPTAPVHPTNAPAGPPAIAPAGPAVALPRVRADRFERGEHALDTAAAS